MSEVVIVVRRAWRTNREASYSVLSSFYLVFDANIGRVFGLVGASDYKREYEYTTVVSIVEKTIK